MPPSPFVSIAANKSTIMTQIDSRKWKKVTLSEIQKACRKKVSSRDKKVSSLKKAFRDHHRGDHERPFSMRPVDSLSN